jgi:transcriptional regulator with XRE-family HTH domain
MEHHFARVLTYLRGDAGITRAELARRAGVHAAQVTRWETADALPSLDVFCRLAVALGHRPSTLMRMVAEDVI